METKDPKRVGLYNKKYKTVLLKIMQTAQQTFMTNTPSVSL